MEVRHRPALPSDETVYSRIQAIEERLTDIQMLLEDRSGKADMQEAANAL